MQLRVEVAVGLVVDRLRVIRMGVAMVALWVRSHYVPDALVWSGSKGQLRELALFPGEIRFAFAARFGQPLEHLTTVDADRVLFCRYWQPFRPTFLLRFDQWQE